MRFVPQDTVDQPNPGLLRCCYWQWQARRRQARGRRILTRLRVQARRAPRFQPGTIRLDGFTVRYDDLYSLYMEYKHIFAWGVYDFEPAGPSPLVLDCGSHIGLSILRFKRLASDARVIGFEPDARLAATLSENIRANDLTNVRIVPAALAASSGTRRFRPDGCDGGALLNDSRAPGGTPEVATVRLSDYLTEPVDLLKMNIEGAECEVLYEADERLHLVRKLVVEYHGFPELRQSLHEILALLDRLGFRYLIHHFDEETNPDAQPPFRVDRSTRFFLLIAAERVGRNTRQSKHANAARSRGATRMLEPV